MGSFLDFFKRHKSKEQLIIDKEKQSTIVESQTIKIEILQEHNYSKVVVGDYYTIQDYIEKIREIDVNGIENLLNNSVIWNSGKQRVNKGTYYIFRHNKGLYNILVNDEQIRIDERIPIGEETSNKVLTFKNSKYQYFRCIHDKNGSSRACRYYDLVDNTLLPLTREEFLTDFNIIMQNLSDFNGIENMINLHKLGSVVSQPICEDALIQ